MIYSFCSRTRYTSNIQVIYIVLHHQCIEVRIEIAYSLPNLSNLLCSGGSSSALSDIERFPTMLRLLPYQQNDLVQTLTLFLKTHQWTDFVLLCDVNPRLGDFFSLACQGFQDAILQTPGYNLMSYNFDTRTTVDYEHYLTQGSQRSRGKNSRYFPMNIILRMSKA